eukprot:787783_1
MTLRTNPTCLLSIAKSKPCCRITTLETRNVINAAKEYAFDNVYRSDYNAQRKVDDIVEFLFDRVDRTSINTRYSAIDTTMYSSYSDYWTQNRFEYKCDVDKHGKNEVSSATERGVMDACNNIINNANGVAPAEIGSKISHVIVHSDFPFVTPPMSSSIIYITRVSLISVDYLRNIAERF